MGRTVLLKRSLALITAVSAIAGFAVSDAGATSELRKATNNLTVRQYVADGSGSGHTKVLVDVKNTGLAASTVLVTGLLSTASSGVGIAASGSGWLCALQGAPAGYKVMYTCSLSSLPADATSRLTLDMSGTAGTTFTNFVSVGERSPGESTLSDNTNIITSWFGPRADLSVTQSAATAAAGHVKITTRTFNRGPWTANNLQMVVEVKATGSLGASATSSSPSAACQIIPPASGYNLAFSCTMSGSLAPRQSWVITVNHSGPAGGTVKIVSKTTAISPVDPNMANNTATTNTTYHS